MLRWPSFVVRVVPEAEYRILVVTVTELPDFTAKPVTSILLDNFISVVGRTWANVRLPLVCGLVQESFFPDHGLLLRGSTRPITAVSRVDVLRIVVGAP
jgi:hypothetical protein